MGIINRIIKKQPTAVKKLYYNIVPFRDRYGKLFGETLDFLNEVDSWSYDRAKEFQFNEIKKMLLHCKNYVPYYSKLFAEYEFDINIQSFDCMNKLPLMDKKTINENFDSLISTNYNGPKVLFKTSGSTGEKLRFYGDDSVFKKEAAYILHSFRSHGANLYDDWSVWIRRHSPRDESELFVKDYELKRIYMSPFHLNEKFIHQYVEIINSLPAKVIVTYPSTAFWLTTLLEKFDLKLNKITSIHCASEKCLPYWNDKIKNYFGFNVKMHYGLIEKASFMYQSNLSNYYHEDLTYSHTEFDKEGYIIGTPFLNYVMPFLRYKTNDQADLNFDVIKDTSRPLTVKEIFGRADDMIVAKNGARIPSVNFYTAMANIKEIKMFQILQSKNKSITFKVVSEDSSSQMLNRLKFEIEKRVGSLPTEIIFVDNIERDKTTGKIRCVLSECKND